MDSGVWATGPEFGTRRSRWTDCPRARAPTFNVRRQRVVESPHDILRVHRHEGIAVSERLDNSPCGGDGHGLNTLSQSGWVGPRQSTGSRLRAACGRTSTERRVLPVAAGARVPRACRCTRRERASFESSQAGRFSRLRGRISTFQLGIPTRTSSDAHPGARAQNGTIFRHRLHKF